MVHPFLIAGALLVKKVAVFTAVEVYGYPRLYRRLREGMLILKLERSSQHIVGETIKRAIRSGNNVRGISNIIGDQDTRKFLSDFSSLVQSQQKSLPNDLKKVIDVLSPFLPFIKKCELVCVSPHKSHTSI